MLRLLAVLFSLLPLVALGQAEQAWPREAATGLVAFNGQLSWPDTIRTELQRQALVRRWYRRGLTDDGPEKLRAFAREAGTTYAGIPQESCYQLRIAGPDKEQYRLCFQVHLLPDAAGLRYKLTNFEIYWAGFDSSSGGPLEDTQRSRDAGTQAVLSNFQQRLSTALKHW